MTKIIKLTTEETAKFKQFQKKHFKKCNSVVKLVISQSGIGQVVEVVCPMCNKTKNITDYSVW